MELKDADNLTPLMIACRYGHVETIMHLLDYGADVTETDKDEKTCLMWAAEENQTDAISVCAYFKILLYLLIISKQEIQ